MKKLFVSVLAIITLVPTVVAAETVVRTADSVSVQADERVDNDFYVAANTISMSGEVAGDMYAAGGAVTVNGPIAADLTVVGGSVQLHATVTDDVRVVAGEVILAEYVGGDVFVMSGLLKVLSTAKIEGDIFFFGGSAEINGPVGGAIMGTYETLRVNAPVAGGIDVTASRGVTLGARAAIEGDVQYTSTRELVRAQDAVVTGSLVRNNAGEGTPMTDWRSAVVPLLFSLFGTLVLYLVAKPLLERMAKLPGRKVVTAGLWGVLVLFGLPLVIVVLVATILGLMVGLITFCLYVAALLVAYIAMPIMVGAWIQRYFFKTATLQLTTVVIGVLVTNVLLFVPYVGGLLLVILLVLTFGMLVQTSGAVMMRLQS